MIAVVSILVTPFTWRADNPVTVEFAGFEEFPRIAEPVMFKA